jgi:hypothetical protein
MTLTNVGRTNPTHRSEQFKYAPFISQVRNQSQRAFRERLKSRASGPTAIESMCTSTSYITHAVHWTNNLVPSDNGGTTTTVSDTQTRHLVLVSATSSFVLTWLLQRCNNSLVLDRGPFMSLLRWGHLYGGALYP